MDGERRGTAPREWIALLGWIALTIAAGAAGAAGSIDAPTFYRALDRPAWAPPAGVFGPVWSVLYLMMAAAAWLAWKESGWQKGRSALVLFCVQLIPNVLWSWLFFAWHRGGLAQADIVILWALVVATVIAFYRIRRAAAWLMVPYLAWVSFAAVLNYAVWQRNPGMLG